MSVYGKEFAAVYDETWPNFSARLWPFLYELVRKRVPDAHDWLDLCCGTGHLLEILVREGFSAVGLDVSPHQLKLARRRASATRLVEADVRSFRLSQ